MAEKSTLVAIFNSTKEELANSLFGFELPKDASKIQETISNYLNKVCDADSDFRQNLTQSEDYILQAALSMLNAQKDLVGALRKSHTTPALSLSKDIFADNQSKSKSFSYNKTTAVHSIFGAGGGALLGKIAIGGWGAVFGAVAGTAVVLYLAQQHAKNTSSHLGTPNSLSDKEQSKSTTHNIPVDTTALLCVVEQLCESLDNLISVFRSQIQRVIHKYESQEKPSIEREYRTLLEGIQLLIGYKRGHQSTEENYTGKLQERIEELAELLDNYDLKTIDYEVEKSSWFEAVESTKATEIRLVAPAIVKNGNLILKGKIFIPQNQ